jgi:hypothetical protein
MTPERLRGPVREPGIVVFSSCPCAVAELAAWRSLRQKERTNVLTDGTQDHPRLYPASLGGPAANEHTGSGEIEL